jgi:hypothetical protein
VIVTTFRSEICNSGAVWLPNFLRHADCLRCWSGVEDVLSLLAISYSPSGPGQIDAQGTPERRRAILDDVGILVQD